jgi:hypothetical protein
VRAGDDDCLFVTLRPENPISQPFLIVTSISAPNAVLRALAEGAANSGFRFTVIGDLKSPADFSLPGCDFYSVDQQISTGYLLAARAGAPLILETDDDNFPRAGFWEQRQRNVTKQSANQRAG